MSVQSAFSFLRNTRDGDAGLVGRVQALGHEADLESLVGIGLQAGYAFTAQELRIAFRSYYVMRWFLEQSRVKSE